MKPPVAVWLAVKAPVRIFHADWFLCRAIRSELAGQTIALKDLTAARRARRRALRAGLRDRASVVDQLLAVHQLDYGDPLEGTSTATPHAEADPSASPRRTLKRYRED